MAYMEDALRARLTELVEELEQCTFREAKWGRRGYSEKDVDEFIDYAVDVVSGLLAMHAARPTGPMHASGPPAGAARPAAPVPMRVPVVASMVAPVVGEQQSAPPPAASAADASTVAGSVAQAAGETVHGDVVDEVSAPAAAGSAPAGGGSDGDAAAGASGGDDAAATALPSRIRAVIGPAAPIREEEPNVTWESPAGPHTGAGNDAPARETGPSPQGNHVTGAPVLQVSAFGAAGVAAMPAERGPALPPLPPWALHTGPDAGTG